MSSRSVGARGAASLKKATRKAVKSAALCAFVISMPQLALAADTTINTAETTTQGPTVPELNGGDTLTIGPAGSVTVTGNDASGIVGTGGGNTVNNYGTITTSGSVVTLGLDVSGRRRDVSGIYITGDSGTINNYGTIETTGNGLSPGGNASGINVLGNSNAIVNYGTINAYGSTNARGIRAQGDNNAITNSGTITTRNSAAIVVYGDSNSVINTGRVLATGDGMQA
jgi:hypothetical protein